MTPPEMTSAGIVLLGSFNPAIFHPAWFKANDLIRSQEADQAKLEISHPEVSSFSIDWFKLTVFLNRFSAETADSYHFEPLRDLVLSVFKLLEHTPASKMGMNTQMHFKMPSEEKWHGFGHLVAPKIPWRKIMNQPGLISLIMADTRKDSPGYVRVKVEPSATVRPGIFIEVNNHYETGIDTPDKNGLHLLMDILKNSWNQMITHSQEIADNLLDQEY